MLNNFTPTFGETLMSITTTTVVIVATGAEFNIPGDRTPQEIVSSYGADIPGLANMDSETTVNGNVKTLTFRPRVGNKG